MTKVALVTGASRGIGFAVAEKFHAEGWDVITLSRHPFEPAPWSDVAESHVQFDLAHPEHIDDAVADIRHRLAGRPLHALVNNAGISPKLPNGDRIGVNAADYEFWQDIFNVNVFSSNELVFASSMTD